MTFRALSEDGSRKKLFDEYVVHLVQKAKDKDRKREKEKDEKVSCGCHLLEALVLLS